MSTAEADSSVPSDRSHRRMDAPAAKSGFIVPRPRAILSIIVVPVLVYLFAQGQLTQESLRQFGTALPWWLFLPAYLVLPSFGFPISVFLLASGLKFGFARSVGIAIPAMAFHTLTAWHIAHGYFRQPLERWLQRSQLGLPQIPEKHQIWFTALFITVPGLPYAAKLYSLALTNLSFRRYFLIVWLFHILNSVLFIGIGAAAGEVDSGMMIALAGLAIAMIAVTKWLKHRFDTSSNNSTDTLKR